MFDSCNPMHYSLQAPLSMGFSKWEYWSGLPFPFQDDLPYPGLLNCREILYRLSYEGDIDLLPIPQPSTKKSHIQHLLAAVDFEYWDIIARYYSGRLKIRNIYYSLGCLNYFLAYRKTFNSRRKQAKERGLRLNSLHDKIVVISLSKIP